MNTPKKTATWPELTAILLARLAVLWLVVFVALLLPTDDIAFYAFMSIAFIITIPYSLWLRNRLRSLQFAPLQFMVDLVLVTGLVYFTGGIRSDFTLLYPLVILSSGIVGTPKQATGITVLAITVYSMMAVMMRNQLLVEYIPAHTVHDMNDSISAIVLRGLVFAFFGGTSIYIAQRCGFIQTQAQTLKTTTTVLLESIPVPALLLSEQGHILFANQPASDALNTCAKNLCTKTFMDLRQDSEPALPEGLGQTASLHRENASALPVAYQTQDFIIPEMAFPDSPKDSKKQIELTLLLFNDISHELSTRRQLEKIERVTSASRIAGEMAHEIQGPLSSLSASLQLLKHYEAKATAADWLPSSPRRRDRNELFEHIEDSSTKMETVIRNFIDFAEFSPKDLLSIIKLDSIGEKQGYISHLNIIGRDVQDGQNTHSG
jgi:hypothetical protein